MRVGFADLVFSWPPHGGADVDLYNTIKQISRLGHEVHLFVSGCEESWERGSFDPGEMPFPATRVDFSATQLRAGPVAAGLRTVIDGWRPDAVFVCDGFFFKPELIEALAHYPLIGRFYAYEIACIRDLLLYRNGAPCPNNYLRTPDECRRCAVSGMRSSIQRWRMLTWAHEFVASRAFMPDYYARVTGALRKLRSAIVYNEIQAGHLAGFVERVHVVPGGVDIADYAYAPLPDRGHGGKKVVLMTGRVEDPMKGLGVLLEAGSLLSSRRSDFEIWATHTDHRLNSGWFRAAGWHDHIGMKSLYVQSDVCVTPSIWEEPFGMVAVEAMACGRPVCASRAGGLQHIVSDGETGFLFDRGDSAALAERLGQLLDDEELRRRMGAAGRSRAEAEFDWSRIAARHYPPILEEAVAR